MKLHTLRPAKGATKKEKRIGRGEASGKGGTSTKGNKGQQAVPVIKANLDTKVARCLSREGFLSVDSKTTIVLNIKYLTSDRLKN